MNRMFRIVSHLTAGLLLIPACVEAAVPMSVYQSMVVPLPRKFANQGSFWSIHAGINSPDSIGLDAAVGAVQLSNDPNILLKGSYNIGASIGYRMERFRPELELTYHSNDIRKVRGLPPGFSNIGPDSIGRFTAVFIMGNLLWDFHFTNGLNPYLGLGLGGAYSEFSAPFINNTGTRVGFSSTGFNLAYQLILGVGYVFSDHTEVDFVLKYLESKLGDFSLNQAQYPPPVGDGAAAGEKVSFEPKSYGATLFQLELRFS